MRGRIYGSGQDIQQVPIFALNTKGAWTLRFDDILADALEAGPLRTEEYPLSDDIAERLKQADLNDVPLCYRNSYRRIHSVIFHNFIYSFPVFEQQRFPFYQL